MLKKKSHLFFLLLVFILTLMLSACATTSEQSKNKEGKNTTDHLSKAKIVTNSIVNQNVKKIDMSYSKKIVLSAKRGRFDCKRHINFKKEEWEKFVESALSCIYDKNWIELSKIADVLSHSHLKAPWGPYYKSIVAFERFNDYQKAEWMCDIALKKSPNSPIIKYQLARIYWHTDRKTKSYELMESIRKKYPKNFDVLRFIGDIEYRDRNFKKALKYYTKISSVYSRDLDFRAALATSLFYTDQQKKSLSHYKYVVKHTEDIGPYLYQIGEVYKGMKNWTLAKKYYLKAMKPRSKTRSVASLDLKKIKIQLDYVDQKLRESSSRGKRKNEK